MRGDGSASDGPVCATVPSSPAGLSGSFGAVPVPEVLATALSKAEAEVLEEEAAAFPLAELVSHGFGRGGRDAMAGHHNLTLAAV